MQVFKPKVRGLNAAPNAENIEPALGQWGSVFGHNPIAQTAVSNYQIKGIVLAGKSRDSAVIVSIDGKPEQTLSVSGEIATGIKLKEIHDTYIIMSENGIDKRIDLPKPAPNPGIIAQPMR